MILCVFIRVISVELYDSPIFRKQYCIGTGYTLVASTYVSKQHQGNGRECLEFFLDFEHDHQDENNRTIALTMLNLSIVYTWRLNPGYGS